jgi:diguanylate cyclase (GGDEF)-like protein
MPDSEALRPAVGLFINPSVERRTEFQAACGESFGRLFLVEDADMAQLPLAAQRIDLLVLDLSGYDTRQSADLAELCTLVRSRHGAPVLVICPYGSTVWIPELMASGPVHYRISPILNDALREVADALLRPVVDAQAAAQQALLDKEVELQDLLAIQRTLQRAMSRLDDLPAMAEKICEALCSFPGVCHAAMLQMHVRGNLALLAQHAPNQLDLADLMGRSERLLESSLRDIFPPLLAASSGELVLLDAPEKTGDPELAIAMHDRSVRMMLAMPLRSEPGAPLQGVLSLMFDRHVEFSREQFACFASLAQFISFGLAMNVLRQQKDELAGALTEIATTDALTGAINRREGERMLDAEIRRARRYGLPLALITFDIDNFRSVNDIYGYPIGDQALRTVANTVQSRLRNSDTLARMRGEEFLIVATHTSAIEGLKLAEKLRETIAGTELPGCDTVTISLGVAQLAPEENGAEALRRLSDALHRAKRAGRNCVELAMAS